jgi:ribosomal protein S3AE
MLRLEKAIIRSIARRLKREIKTTSRCEISDLYMVRVKVKGTT